MKTQLLKILAALIVTIIFFFSAAKAQIIYTNVNPDQTCITDGCTYNLDLNNDGANDFIIKYDTVFKICCGSSRSFQKVSVNPLLGSGIAVDIHGLPSAMNEGDLISPSVSFDTVKNQILSSTEPACIPFDHGLVCVPDVNGPWSGVFNKYLGLQISFGGNHYYGWARLDVAAGGSSFTLKDYAYNATPNQFILAGDTGTIITGFHNIKAFSSITVSPNGFQQATRISFSLPQTEKVSVQIYNVQGRLIRTLMQDVMSAGTHTLTWDACDENGNAVSAGIYFLKIQSEDFSQTEKLMVIK